MSSIATAVVGGAIIGGVMSSKASKDASEEAADAQRDAATMATDTEMEMFNMAREDYSPYRETGEKALPLLEEFAPSDKAMNLLQQMEGYSPLAERKPVEFDPNDPIYKWRLQKGEEAVNRAYAARGMYDSRPAVNSLMDVTMGLSAAESDKQYARGLDDYGMALDEYNRLSGLYGSYNALDAAQYNRLLDRTQIGAGAASASGSAALQTGGNLANIYSNLGSNLSSNYLQQGANEAQFWSQMGAMPATAVNAYKSQSPTAGSSGSSTPYFDATSSYGGYTPRYQ